MTEKQAYIYDIINKWWIKHGFAPSIDDIMDITGDRGRGNVHRTMKKLVALGHFLFSCCDCFKLIYL